MRKFILTVCLAGYFCSQGVFASDFTTAMRYYNAGNYERAKIEFRDLISKNSSDVNARYMYAQALIKTKDFENARKEYKNITSISPNSKAGKLSQKGIAILDKYISENSLSNADGKSDYIENAFKNGQRHVWETSDVTFFVQNHKLKPVAVNALTEWSKATGRALTFSEVSSKDDAQIKIFFGKGTVFPNNTSMENGTVSFDYSGQKLTNCTVTVNSVKENGQTAEADEIRPIILHLTGHAIGIEGHSPVAGDVMSKASPLPVQSLSVRDKNTAAKLYNEFSGVKVSEKQAQNAELEAAQSAVGRDPDSAEAVAELAAAMAATGNISSALNYYKKSLLIEENVEVYKKMADIYNSIGDKDEEIVCAKAILRLEPDNITALENIIENYVGQNRYTEARAVLDDFIATNPDMAGNSVLINLKNDLNDKKLQFIDAKQRRFRNIR